MTDRLRTAIFAVIGTAALAGLGLLAYYISSRPEEVSPPVGTPSVNVETELVTTIPEFADDFALPGTIEPNRVVNVAAEVDGRIERILCEEGAACQAGDKLIELNTDLLKAEYDSAAARANHAAVTFKRMSNLHEQGTVPKRDLDRAQAELATADAAVAAAKARLDRAGIVAPISGVLNRVPVEEGEYVQTGAPVAQIVELDPVKAVVHVPEHDVQHMQNGAKAQISANVKGTEIDLTGTITYISKLADAQTRCTRMEITVDNPERVLHSGRIVRARLTRRILKNVIMVPLAAVIPMENGKAVYVVNGAKAIRREVTLGLIRGRKVQIVGGLEAGDRLIVAGHRFVAPGQPVQCIEDSR